MFGSPFGSVDHQSSKMEASLTMSKLECHLEDVKESLKELKLENAALQKELSGKGVKEKGVAGEGKGESFCAEKTLREVVEEMAYDIKSIEGRGDAPATGAQWVSPQALREHPHVRGLMNEDAMSEPLDGSGSESGKDAPLFIQIPVFNAEGGNEAESEALVLKGDDLCIQDNGNLHQTAQYSIMQKPLTKGGRLVVRRGQEFSLKLELDREYVKGRDRIILTFFLADGAKHKNYTCIAHTTISTANGIRTRSTHPSGVIVYITESQSTESTNGWFGHIDSVDGNCVLLKIKASAACPIGKWMLDVELSSSSERDRERKYAFTEPIYILFNPWCPEDHSYYPERGELESYVLSPYGKIYNGRGQEGIGERTWQYEQFEEEVLDSALLLLNLNQHFPHGPLNGSDRGDIVKVTRQLVSAINASDEGVPKGEYGKERSDLRSWNSSREILQGFWRVKQKHPRAQSTLKCGQGWVFAGVLTTVCRALGIPSRVVTNYRSGYENTERKGGINFSLEYYYEDGKRITRPGDDRLWNYQVWCEAWMKREDLPGIYAQPGWQVLASVPGERSGRGHPMGPAPVEACLRGDVKVPYDVDFIFSAVNAGEVLWESFEGKDHARCEKRQLLPLDLNPDVGQKLSTEDPEKQGQRKDITKEYKHAEGSEAEREALQNALKKSGLDYGRIYEDSPTPEVWMEAKVDEAFVGQPLRFQILTTNKSEKAQRGSAWIQVYTTAPPPRVEEYLIWERGLDFDLGPGEKDSRDYSIEYEHYRKYLTVRGKDLRIEYSASVKDTGIVFLGRSFFSFSEPVIHLSVPEHLYQGKRYQIVAKFQNPLPTHLNDGKFTLYGTGCRMLPSEEELMGPLNPGETISATFELDPLKSGDILVTVDFYSKSSHVSAHGECSSHVDMA